MFTGIINHQGTVRDVIKTARDTRFIIHAPDFLTAAAPRMGASIAHNGVCLTLVEQVPDWYAVEVSEETLMVTTMRDWAVGTIVNLEPSMKMGDELGGHLVSGHIDGITQIISVVPEGGSHRIRLRIPPAHTGFIAAKGSIALDGISLTVNDVANDDTFGINIIPHTWDYTNFHRLKLGDRMNYEIDVMARYAARLMQTRIV